jgi:hypothetical protein
MRQMGQPCRTKSMVSRIEPGDLFRLGNLTFLLLHAEERRHVLAAVLPSHLGLRRVPGDVEIGAHLIRGQATRLVKGPLTGAVIIGRLAPEQLVKCVRESALSRRKNRKHTGASRE